MKRLYSLWTAVLLAFLLPIAPAMAGLFDTYVVSGTSSTYPALAGGTNAIATNYTNPWNVFTSAGPFNIGFTFNFNGTNYTQFTVGTNGTMVLGTGAQTSPTPSLDAGGVYPILAPLWNFNHTRADAGPSCTDVGVWYAVTGTAPNRMLTVEWRVNPYWNGAWAWVGCNGSLFNFQARLYEGSNIIEFQYGSIYVASSPDIETAAGIGISAGASNFISITPGSSTTASQTVANNSVNLLLTPISSGTTYRFSPCTFSIVGRTGATDGGTSTMTNGDILLAGKSAMKYGGSAYTPFSLTMDNTTRCADKQYKLDITGANAGEYYFNGVPGQRTFIGTASRSTTVTPTINFSPTALGARPATLTITDVMTGTVKTYGLNGVGTSRVQFNGNLSQGGTAAMANGDALLDGMTVVRRGTGTFQPFSVQNLITAAGTPSATVTYTIVDPSGQYSISPASTVLGPGGTHTPTITFSPTGVATQTATLIVNADGDVRTFTLRGFSAAPAAEFRIGGNLVGVNTGIMAGQTNCVGESYFSVPMEVKNIGYGAISIDGGQFFATDSAYKQGAPHYANLRDAQGRLIPMPDYVITTSPGVGSASAGAANYPIVIPQGQTQTVYITYVPQRPGKRFARAYIRTNAQNFLGVDPQAPLNAVPSIEGVLNFELFANAVGAGLSDNPTGGLPKTVVFSGTSVGDSADMTFSLVNYGSCDLRIARKQLEVNAGDDHEFSLVSAFATMQPDADGNYVFAPGASGSVTVRFKPQQIGSRRASLMVKTNDSTISIPGVSERGVYYLDLYGEGTFNYKSSSVSFAAAAMGADTTHGVAEFINTMRTPLTISNVAITGTDATEFAQDMKNKPWPAANTILKPGQHLMLGVQFQPASAGVNGTRNAMLEVTLSDGNILKANLDGMAGTRSMQVNPATVAFTPIAKGKEARQTITVTNTGTMPVTLTTAPALSGANAADFSLSAFPRLMLAPGQVEFLEVTYHPTVAGSSTAQVDFTSNAGPMQSIGLTATASSTKLDLDSKVRLEISSIGGQAAERILKLRNESNEAVSISDVRFSGADAAQFRVVRGADRVEANAEGELVVEVIPAGHDLVAELALTATNEVTGEQLVRVAEIRAEEQRTSGVSGEDAVAGGLELRAAVPNPTHGAVELSYRMVKGTEIRLSLYDMNGTLVKVLDGGYRGQGEHVVRVDLSDLASGQYQYRLTAGSVTLTKPLTVVR